MRDHFEFFRQFRQRFETTGAIAPSSRFLANRMLSTLNDRPDRPIRILEVGPGTGAVTQYLVNRIQPGDHLDLVELNESFVRILERDFQQKPSFQRIADQVQIHSCPIQEFPVDAPYDVIISGLPFNNFPPELVEEIVSRFFEILAPDGRLAYFEYMFVRPIKIALCRRPVKQRLTALEQILGRFRTTYGEGKDWIFLNLPPAWVQHHRQKDRNR